VAASSSSAIRSVPSSSSVVPPASATLTNHHQKVQEAAKDTKSASASSASEKPCKHYTHAELSLAHCSDEFAELDHGDPIKCREQCKTMLSKYKQRCQLAESMSRQEEYVLHLERVCQ
jgi:hypothetical protein